MDARFTLTAFGDPSQVWCDDKNNVSASLLFPPESYAIEFLRPVTDGISFKIRDDGFVRGVLDADCCRLVNRPDRNLPGPLSTQQTIITCLCLVFSSVVDEQQMDRIGSQTTTGQF